MRLKIGQGKFRYQWIENWASIPYTPSGNENGRTHGVVVSQDGRVFIFHQAKPAVLVFDERGKLLARWGDRFLGAHGMTLVKEGKEEFLWLTDQDSAEVVKTTLDGKTIQQLPRPPHPIYSEGKYSPTWVAVNEERFGGNGDIWVADGYGMSFIHRFDKQGNYCSSIHGEEGDAGAFNCPHGIFVDRRKKIPELYIADRGNKRFQVYDLDGHYKRTFGSEFLTCPCASVSFGDNLIVPELSARLTILDASDKPVSYLGDNEQTCRISGWPDHDRDLLYPGKFNSPHSAAVDAGGNLYVVEWIKGGRITKLVKS